MKNEMDVDVLIIGSGPAGMQASMQCLRQKLSVIIAGKKENSWLHFAHIENLFGVTGVVPGEELLNRGLEQVKHLGAKLLNEDVIRIDKKDDRFLVMTEGDILIKSRAIVLGMGINRNRLGVKGETELVGKGVSYCADCDAPFYRNVPVAVIGTGSAAASSAILCRSFTNEVYWITDHTNVSENLLNKAKEAGIKLIVDNPVKEIIGEHEVMGIRLSDGGVMNVKGVFIELGSRGALEILSGLNLFPNEKGYMDVDRNMKTKLDGVYAAGDMTGPPFQVSKAVGEGCVAGFHAAEYVKSKRS